MHVSPPRLNLNLSRAPGAFYKYNIPITTPVSAWKKLSYHTRSSLEVPTDVLNHFCIQVAVSLLILKPPHGGLRGERPSRGRFGSKRLKIHNGYMLTANGNKQCPFGCSAHAMAVAAGKS